MPDRKGETKWSRQPRQHRVEVCEPRLAGVLGRSWSYKTASSRDVYVELVKDGKHVVTLKVRVPR